MPTRLGVVMHPIQTIQVKKDTTFAMLLLSHKHEVGNFIT